MVENRDESPVAAPVPPLRPPIDPAQWVERYGDFLFRHALLRVRQHQAAEDLVQEVFLAAWQHRARFAGRASEKTWLLRILRNKIADHYRRLNRDADRADLDTLGEFEDRQFESGGFGAGHWRAAAAPQRWANPTAGLDQAEFWATLDQCTGSLPGKAARAFVLRDVDQFEIREICDLLQVSAPTLFVILHRARMALRRCLELNWFKSRRHGGGDPPPS